MQGYTIEIMYGLDEADEIRKAFCINENFRPGTKSGTASDGQFIHRGPVPAEVARGKVEKPKAE